MRKTKKVDGDREQTTLRLPSELLEELRRQAQERGMSFNDYVLLALNRCADRLAVSGHALSQKNQCDEE